MRRHHRLSIGFMHEVLEDPEKRLEKAASAENRGDVRTKPLGPQKHLAAMRALYIGKTYEDVLGARLGRRRL